MSVRFNRAHGNYNKGETATFSAGHEDWLTKKNIATRVAAPEADMAKSAGDEKKGPPQGGDPKGGDPGGPQTRQTTVGPQRGGR